MAKISAVTADEAAEDEGDWIAILECDDLEVRTRGYTDRYQDLFRQKTQRAARAYGNDPARIPEAIRRKIGTDCLLAEVTLDVRNLEGCTFDDVKRMVYEPRFRPLLDHLYAAANIMQARRASDLEDAGPSSVGPSASPSNGDAAGQPG